LQDAKIVGMRIATVALLTLFLIGCTHRRIETETVTTVRETPVAQQPPLPQIDQIIFDVQNAPAGESQADALRRMHKWMADHRMTFHVTVQNMEGQAVSSPSTAWFPVRATVSIIDRDQPYRDFVFVPRDNRNLTILGLD